MNDINGAGCKMYREIRDTLKNSSTEYLLVKDTVAFNLNPVLSNTTGIPLTTYEDGLELCHFIEDAWVDGYDFTTFNYTVEL